MIDHFQNNRNEFFNKFENFINLLQLNISQNNNIQENSPILKCNIKNLNTLFEIGFKVPKDVIQDQDNSKLRLQLGEIIINYYPVFNEHLDLPTIQYVNLIENQIEDKDKSLIWILLELSQNTFLRTFDIICQNQNILGYYEHTALIKKYNTRIRELIFRLNNFKFTIKSQHVIQYEQKFLQQQYKPKLILPLPSITDIEYQQSSITNLDTETDKIYTQVEKKESQATSFSFGRPSKISEKDNINGQCLHVIMTGTTTPEPTFPNCYSDPGSLIKGFDSHRSASVCPGNINSTVTTPNDTSNITINNHQDIKSMNNSLFIVDNDNDIRNDIDKAKYIQGIKDNLTRFKTLIKILEPNNNTNANAYANNNDYETPQKRKPEFQNSLYLKSSVEKESQSPSKYSTSFNPSTLKFNLEKRLTKKEKSSIAPISSSQPSSFHKKFQALENYDKPLNTFSSYCEMTHQEYIKSEISKQKKLKNPKTHQGLDVLYPFGGNMNLKNSEVLYLDEFENMMFEYRSKPNSELQARNFTCASCNANLGGILGVFKSNYCNYTGQWFCSQCMSTKKHYLPWEILEKWEFKKFNVSKIAESELEFLYDKPILWIDIMSDLIKMNKEFYQAMVLKRQLHLMFDTICETSLFDTLMPHNKNLLLKHFLFSIKDLKQIYDGKLQPSMTTWYDILAEHITKDCQECMKKGKSCDICKNPKDKLYAFDVQNTAFCTFCKRFCHTKCLKHPGCSCSY